MLDGGKNHVIAAREEPSVGLNAAGSIFRGNTCRNCERFIRGTYLRCLHGGLLSLRCSRSRWALNRLYLDQLF